MAIRTTGGFIPPAAPVDFGSQSKVDIRDADTALWNLLSARAAIPINVPSGAASGIVLARPCILAGWSLRETTGTADLQIEFLDGQALGGPIVGEQTILAPLPGSVGQVFTDVDSVATAAAASAVATLAGAAGATTFITGFEVTGLGATGAGAATVTVAGVDATSPVYDITVPAGATVPITPLIVQYSRPIPATALNTAITVTVTSFGTGNTVARVHAHGYQLVAGSTASQSGQSATSDLGEPGVFCRGGLYLRVITGSVVGSAWVRV